ncbi:ornithine cyclodeaminase family protein [Saccharopolyspora phatthalungensis]|uniref:Ornithine cyclodeaminase n=1 Tax=Saccharopolyspora phatthalungensis TaxID=664693 RepID=A0A840QKY0_9PSEU|nr:ornithine cyclodeaminase family protein [Saccharopolyspora phatthalungensis]MBB5159813.1 ornithine cyclodeaminase [Saccharopolyspora phatthalungensis]
MPVAVAAVRDAFISLARGEFSSPLRTSFDCGRTLVMPVFHSPTGSSTTKSVILRPGQRPAIRGVVTWISEDLELVLDAHAVTTLRTGAVVGVATEMLARPDAHRLVLIGAGTLAFDQIRAVAAVRDLEHVVIVSRSLTSADALGDRVRSAFPELTVVTGLDPAPHLGSADIVCCATSSTRPVFDPADLPEVVHINAIGAYTLNMRELPSGAFAGADVVVDDLEAARSEAGDLMDAIADGVLSLGSVTELSPRLNANEKVRRGRTVFKSVGLGIQDWAICDAVASQLAASGERDFRQSEARA